MSSDRRWPGWWRRWVLCDWPRRCRHSLVCSLWGTKQSEPNAWAWCLQNRRLNISVLSAWEWSESTCCGRWRWPLEIWRRCGSKSGGPSGWGRTLTWRSWGKTGGVYMWITRTMITEAIALTVCWVRSAPGWSGWGAGWSQWLPE